LETKTTLNKTQEIPEKIIVLFFASNPLDQQKLRLDEEARSIAEMIQKSKHRNSVKFESCWAVQTIDIFQALNEFKPTIVHFSGHGSDRDEILLQDQSGNTKYVTKEAIVQTMRSSSNNLRMVFFNTCFSKNQAEAIVKSIESAIGMNTSIGDEAARVFSSQFYSSIGFGLSIQRAFDQAKAALMLEGITEENIPELFIQEGLNSEDLILVTPK
ncbi:CHAT domain-containing protein, partial [bacterium]|nr:CHAT domain-containing protein [bacterium]